MKTIQEITNLIETKIQEHKKIIELISEDLKEVKKESNIENAYKSMVVKDRIMFHKAAILVLNDVLKDMSL